MDLSIGFALLVVFVLILLSAFFSSAETALTAASRARMHSMDREGNKRAKLVNKLREHKDRLIGALLLGNSLVNIMASAIATSALIKVFGEAGVLYATGFITVLVLIFAEVLPKTYALHYADRFALSVAPLVRIVVALFSPVTNLVAKIVRGILKLFGVDITAVAVGSHIEELRGVIDLHRGPDEDIQEERAMLRSILDLADVEVHEIMVHRRSVFMIDASLPATEILDAVLNSSYTRHPVWMDEKDNIIGVIHTKSLLRAMRENRGDVSKIDLKAIASEPWFIPETTTLFDQLQEFRSRREHFALVVDEYGSFMGVVTLEDILEEIVGEIDDEHDVKITGVRAQPNGSYLVSGDVTIRDLKREYDWRLPDEEYATVAGLILFESQSIPDVGQTFTFYGFRFEVLKRQRNQIMQVRITPPPKKSAIVQEPQQVAAVS